MDAIVLHGVKTHNLKGFDLILPHNRLYVVTGVSGSGKSSLAFDTLYAEGQRRYVESLSAYARQFLERMEKPDIEAVSGIPPAIAIEAKNVISNARSTVGTQTEINDYLRVLFARIGKTVCPRCNLQVMRQQPDSIADLAIERFAGEKALILFPLLLGKRGKSYLKEFLPELERQGFLDFYADGKVLDADSLLKKKKLPDELMVCVDQIKPDPRNRKRLVEALEQAYQFGHNHALIAVNKKLLRFSEDLKCLDCGSTFKEPTPNLFAFNSPLGACAKCQGFGRVITRDWNLIIPDPRKSLAGGAIEPWTKPSSAWEKKGLQKFCQRKKIPLHTPWQDLSEKHRKWIREGLDGDDYFSITDFFDYLEKKTYKMHVRIFLSKYRGFIPCDECSGARLKQEALAVKLEGMNIAEMQDLSIQALVEFFDKIRFKKSEFERIEPVYLEIKNRLRFLNEVGLGYLSISRLSRTLSGGEVQRIHLATSLGSALVDTLYVLDEPSIGLHERDNQLLIRLLKELRDLGNTVVVVEHDRTMIEAADEVIDLGPTGGEQGGRLVFQGQYDQLCGQKDSTTGQYLSGKKRIQRRPHLLQNTSADFIRIRGAKSHNLAGIDVDIPLRQLVVISGVSGSGKSSLLYDVFYSQYMKSMGKPVQEYGEVRSLKGLEHVDDVCLIDQSPIGRTPRSNPVTYVKAFDDIRKVFAATPAAKRLGLMAGHFSFNVDGGRCPECKGDGRIKVEMHFLADVFIPCEACEGTRYLAETLEVRYAGKNIHEVLSLTIDDACEFFSAHPKITKKLKPLQNVGLGYLRLGQSATTLSGGEAQRLKLAHEMGERRNEHVLYLFDEPTTGLHYRDIQYLMSALDELLACGHSLVLIEHNMEVIGAADYIIDLGPEGGEGGGQVVYQGALKGILECRNSHTGKYLRQCERALKVRQKSLI